MAEYQAPPENIGYNHREALHAVLYFAERFIVETSRSATFRTWDNSRLLHLIELATDDFLRGARGPREQAPFQVCHRVVDAATDTALGRVGLLPPQLTVKLVAIETANRESQNGGRAVRITLTLLRSLIESLLANQPWWAKWTADAFREILENLEALRSAGEP